MNQDILNYVKKTVTGYLKENSLQVPVVKTPNNVNRYGVIKQISEDLGYTVFEDFNCNNFSNPVESFRRLTMDIVSNKKNTVLFIDNYSNGTSSLRMKIDSYLKNYPNHVKVILGDTGPYPIENVSRPVKKSCNCLIQDLMVKGCRCGAKE